MLSPEEIQAARTKLGITPPASSAAPDRVSILDSAWAESKPKPGVFDTIKSDFNKRVDKGSDAIVSKQNPFSKALQTVGQGAGFVDDVVGDVVAPVAHAVGDMVKDPTTGETLSDKVSQRAGEIASTAPVKNTVEAYSAWEKAHPEAAKNLGAVVNIAGLLPIGKGSAVATDIAEQGVVKGATGAIDTVKALPKMIPDQAKHIDSLEKTYQELAGTTSRTKKILTKGQAKTEALNRAGTTGATPERLLAENGIIPKQEGTRLATLQQAEDFRATTEPLRQANRDAIREVEHSVPKTNLDELERKAIAMAREEKNVDAGKSSSMVRDIQDAFAEYRQVYGDSIPLSKVDDIKTARWADTKFDSTKPLKSDVNYAIAKSAQKTIEETASKAGFEDVAQLNRHIGDRLEAAKFLESLDNKTLARGQLGKYIFMGIGSTLGNTVPGKILGALGGEAVAHALMSASIAGPTKRLILRRLQTTDPEAYTTAIKWLEEHQSMKAARALLPESAAPIINEGRPIQVAPAGSTADYVGKDLRI